VSILRAFLPLALLLAAAAPAWADGTVYRVKGCGDRIFVSSGEDYSVLVKTTGDPVAEGDEIIGDVVNIGHPELLDRSTGRTFSAIVEDRHLGRTEINQRIAVRCRSPVGPGLVTGTVERSAGCGNKIFLATPRGYAMLDRSSGGNVSNGDHLTGDFNRSGRATVQNRETGGTLTVFVDDYMMSRAAVNARIAASCR